MLRSCDSAKRDHIEPMPPIVTAGAADPVRPAATVKVMLEPRASILAKLRGVIAQHADAEVPDPDGLADDVLALVDVCTPAEREYLERLGARVLAAVFRDERPPV